MLEPGFAAEFAVKSKHKKYDEIFKNHPFLDHLKMAAEFKLEDRADFFITTMTRKIVLNHRKNVVLGMLDFLG